MKGIPVLVYFAALVLPALPQDASQGVGLTNAPLTTAQVLVWMDGGDESARAAQLIERRGIDFSPTEHFLKQLAAMHAKPILLEKLKQATVVRVANDPATEQSAFFDMVACLQSSDANASAADACKKAAAIEPSTARFALGLRALHSGRAEEARSTFIDALVAEPGIADFQSYLGFALHELHELDLAESAYRKAMSLDPEFETPVNNLASLFLEKNDPVQAEKFARQALALIPDDASAHHNLGVALIKQSKAHEGIQELSEAERLEPENPFRHKQMGEILEIGKRYDAALAEYRQAADLAPQDLAIHKKIMTMLLLLHQPDQAIVECEKLQTLAKQHPKESCKDFVRRTFRK
jgi:Flp pilus assembly protein TadD